MAFTVLSAEFVSENNTFKKGFTELRDFAADCLVEGDAAFALRGDANTELAGLRDVAREMNFGMIHVISALATPAAPVSAAAYDHIAGVICRAAERHRGAYQGIFLSLHGAQVAEHAEDGEGELLTRLRAVVGPDMPIAVTLDLHANVTRAMADQAEIIVSYKTYPHVDLREVGRHAARLLQGAMAGTTRPVTLCRKVPIMGEANSGRSDKGPLVARYALARQEEREPGILAVSLNAGFPEADIAEMGPSALVTYDRATAGAEARAEAIAEAHARSIWDNRAAVENRFLSVEEAAAEALAHESSTERGKGPLVIADFADNPGAGTYGDATNLLAALLKAGVRDACFAPIIDPECARALHGHAEGETVTLPVGGKCDPAFGGGPLLLTGRILRLSDGAFRGDGPMLGGLDRSYGPTAVLRVEGIDILIVTENEQMLDRQQLYAFGIDPTKKAVLALKSMQHFRAAFEPIAARVIVCDSGALATPNVTRRNYVRVRRPIWPLDPQTHN